MTLDPDRGGVLCAANRPSQDSGTTLVLRTMYGHNIKRISSRLSVSVHHRCFSPFLSMMMKNVLVTFHGLLKFGILVCGLPVFVTIFGTNKLLIV
jgi:hypothetical protein